MAQLRHTLAESERVLQAVCHRHGCTPSQYQLLLTIRTTPGDEVLDIGQVARRLRVRHPSAAEMVRKAQARGYVNLAADPTDARRVLVQLSSLGRRVVDSVSADNVQELRRLGPALRAALDALG